MKDYYKILGVDKSATDSEIKKAYKKLAKKWHPDNHTQEGEDKIKEAEEKMKEINEAYDVLKDKDKRERYDNPSYPGEEFEFDLGDIFGRRSSSFDDIFGHMNRKAQPVPKRGEDLEYPIKIELEDCVNGLDKNIKISHLEECDICGGTGSKDKELVECDECHGQGMTTRVERTSFGINQFTTTCSKCKGMGKIPKTICSNCNGTGKIKKEKTIELHIPKGILDGNRLRVKKEGNAGSFGGETGDLYVNIRVKPHKIFKQVDHNLHIEVPITFVQAILGDKIEVPTIKGKKTKVKIPAGTQSDTEFKVKNEGIPYLRKSTKGDMIVKVKVLTPQNLSDKQIEILKEFESISENKSEVNT